MPVSGMATANLVGWRLFQSAESDLVTLHGGRPSVTDMADDAKGRLEAIAEAVEEVYLALRSRLQPDEVLSEKTVRNHVSAIPARPQLADRQPPSSRLETPASGAQRERAHG